MHANEPITLRRSRHFLLILLVAATVRVSYVMVVKAGPCVLKIKSVVVGVYHSECTGENDQVNYNTTANVLARGGGFAGPAPSHLPLAEHPPMTTVVLGGVSFAFDHLPLSWVADETRFPLGTIERTHVREHRMFLALLGTVNVGLITLIVFRSRGLRTALIAGWISATYPFLWVNDGVIMSETIAIFLVSLIALALLSKGHGASKHSRWMVGVLCGFLALTRAELALIAPLTVVASVWSSDASRRRLMTMVRNAMPIVLGMAIVVTPWIVYNNARFERRVTLSTNDGITFAGSYCQPSFHGTLTGLWIPSPPCLFTSDQLAALGPVDASVISGFYKRKGLDYLKANASQLPRVALTRVARLWNLYRPLDMIGYNQGESRERWVTSSGLIMYFVLMPFAGLGLARLLRRNRRFAFIVMQPAAAVTLAAMALYAQTRLRAPAETTLIILAAVGADALAERARSSRATTFES